MRAAMRRIKLRHLDTLSVFMKTGSVTEAALVLGTTQPNASKSLKQLEEVVGVTLFQRVAGRLRPTPEAEILYAHATRLIHELTLFEHLSIDLVALQAGFVNIGILSAFSTALVPMAIERFNTRYPTVQVQVDLLDSDKIHAYVSRGTYDFGLVHHPEQEPDLLSETIITSSMVCIAPAGHPLAALDVVTAQDLEKYPLVTYPRALPFGTIIHRALSEQGVRPQAVLTSNQSQLVRRLVERQRGAALIDPFSVWDLADGDLVVARPFEPRIPVSVGMIVPKRRPLSLAARAFADIVQEVLAEGGGLGVGYPEAASASGDAGNGATAS
jgi:DNA-binding transcriptional LysR family regulator